MEVPSLCACCGTRLLTFLCSFAGVERAVRDARLSHERANAASSSDKGRMDRLEASLREERAKTARLERELAAATRPRSPPFRAPRPASERSAASASSASRRQTTSLAPRTQSLQGQLMRQCAELAKLRAALAAVESGEDGVLPLSRLREMLDRALRLQESTLSEVAAGEGGGPGEGRRVSVDEEVSLADDGSAGVGATAAAAVSVALAQSWAATARHATPSSAHASFTRANGGASPGNGRARFKLVAAVPRSRRKKVPGDGGATQTTLTTKLSMLPTESSVALDSLADASRRFVRGSALVVFVRARLLDSAMDDEQEATWRACGSHLKLHWLSSPRSVLLSSKPAPSLAPRTVDAVLWLVRRGLTVDLDAALRTWKARRGCWGRGRSGQAGEVGEETGSGGEEAEEYDDSEPLWGDDHEVEQSDGHTAARRRSSTASRSAPPTANPYADVEGPEPLPARVASAIDLVVTLGGDGTLLWACSLFGDAPVPPIVAFAMGSLGFMTPFPAARLCTVLSRVASTAHGFPIMLRHRLQVGLGARCCARQRARRRAPPPPSMVLNELVIDRGTAPSLTNLHVYADGAFVTVVQGDGLIVATPTGSTAYNLAAGGSMVHPGVPCLLFTPICPHTLSSRPLVFPEHVALTIVVPREARAGVYASFDGKHRVLLAPGDGVAVRASQFPVPTVCNLDASNDWFRSVRDGLNWNARVVQGAGEKAAKA
ncbi:putative NAD kinase 1 [Auxenochlorella protothecoides]|nr:putative NAD kinase 1 [Auxenochlorella protothecoides]KFM28585.1 putative NAD kinase 1 [Auxenochlorella protothecoides]